MLSSGRKSYEPLKRLATLWDAARCRLSTNGASADCDKISEMYPYQVKF